MVRILNEITETARIPSTTRGELVAKLRTLTIAFDTASDPAAGADMREAPDTIRIWRGIIRELEFSERHDILGSAPPSDQQFKLQILLQLLPEGDSFRQQIEMRIRLSKFVGGPGEGGRYAYSGGSTGVGGGPPRGRVGGGKPPNPYLICDNCAEMGHPSRLCMNARVHPSIVQAAKDAQRGAGRGGMGGVGGGPRFHPYGRGAPMLALPAPPQGGGF